MEINEVKARINPARETGSVSPLIYGHFLEHFHRQIYGGVYDPTSPYADEDGFRTDVLEALREIRVPVVRWPGGCFVSAYHWRDGIGKDRHPSFDKAWRVEEPNTFGTDEFVRYCRKLGALPYICTNAGTGTPEEMSDWVEYCNLKNEGRFARERIANGFPKPHKVRYWSIGNENWGPHEIGAKTTGEWGLLVREAAKMMLHVDPEIELSAAAIPDTDWNMNLLKTAGPFIKWISIHGYWDPLWQENNPASYTQVMAYTGSLEDGLKKTEGLLAAMGLSGKIRIAYDEWNLRGWHHPGIHTMPQSADRSVYIDAQDKNDDNRTYTMADAVFAACFLNMCHRHSESIGMANFAPAVNARGCIFTHHDGIVLRSTYYVFWLYTHYMGDRVVDLWEEETPQLQVTAKDGCSTEVRQLDLLATVCKSTGQLAIAAVNKAPSDSCRLQLDIPGLKEQAAVQLHTLTGASPDAYNDAGHTGVSITDTSFSAAGQTLDITLPPHSVSIIVVENGIPT